MEKLRTILLTIAETKLPVFIPIDKIIGVEDTSFYNFTRTIVYTSGHQFSVNESFKDIIGKISNSVAMEQV